MSEEKVQTVESYSVSKITKDVTYNIVTSGLFRKGVFMGTMYVAGGTIVSAVGIGPVAAIGVAIWLL